MELTEERLREIIREELQRIVYRPGIQYVPWEPTYVPPLLVPDVLDNWSTCH